MTSTTAASNQRIIVLDASVAVKWYLQDEDLSADAATIRDDLAAARITVVVPDHFRVEVGNAIRNALRPNRLTVETARRAMTTLATLPVYPVPLDDLIVPAFDAAVHYDCALYDALYLSLAERLSCSFVHADRRLHNTLAGRLAHEVWVEDYRPA